MTATAVRAGPPPSTEPRTPARRVIAWLQVPWRACAVLLVVYVALAGFNDPRGALLADSGGKLATMRVIEQRGALDPDLGYWAAAEDPSGELHPLHYTKRVGDGFVQATTLPMIVASAPLYDVGGTRAALALPMIGGVLVALAARALARRLGGGAGAGWTAFWVIGLTSPVVLYATSFWEHSLGLAAMLWAITFTVDVVDGRGSSWRAVAVGVLFGAAITMRGEALVYAVITAAVAGVTMLLRRQQWSRIVGAASGSIAGLAAVLVVNHALEVRVLGDAIRASGSSGVATAARDTASGLADRVGEALVALTAVNGYTTSLDTLVGAVIVASVCVGVFSLTEPRPRVAVAATAAGLAVVLYAVRFGAGVGYVPGLLTACPLAAVGVVALVRRSAWWFLGLLALAPLPVVWLTQYAGTQRFQWGSRYALTSAVLLAVMAVVALRNQRAALALAIGLTVLVTGFGLRFVAERTHSIGDGMAALVARDDEVLVSVEPHLLREGGDYYRTGRRWLTATTSAELDRAARIAVRRGAAELAVVGPAGLELPETLGPFRRTTEQHLRVRPEQALTVVEYHAT